MESESSPAGDQSLVNRMLRASKLEAQLYEEVEADKDAMPQAITVVVLASVAAGLGNFQGAGLIGILFGTLANLAFWYIWAYSTYLIGTRLLPEPQTRADVGELLRTTGFSSAPGVIRILGIIPGLMTISFAIAHVWMLVSMVVAVRQALDYTGTMRAIGVCLIGWLALTMIFGLLMMLLASGGGG